MKLNTVSEILKLREKIETDMNEYKKLDLLNTSNDMQSNSDAFSNHT